MPVFERPRDNKPIENEGQYHLPCVLLLDTSESMRLSLSDLIDGVRLLIRTISEDEVASERVEVILITYDDKVKVITPFGPVHGYEVPRFDCGGMTHMHEAIGVALDEIEKRKSEYKVQGTPYYRPWIFMMTDGHPNDSDHGEFDRLRRAQEDKKTTFFGVGMGSNADVNLLKSLNINGISLSSTAEDYKGVFEWLSASASIVSSSTPGDETVLPDPSEFGQIKIIS